MLIHSDTDTGPFGASFNLSYLLLHIDLKRLVQSRRLRFSYFVAIFWSPMSRLTHEVKRHSAFYNHYFLQSKSWFALKQSCRFFFVFLIPGGNKIEKILLQEKRQLSLQHCARFVRKSLICIRLRHKSP